MVHTATVAGDRFVLGIADLPLMPGLYLVDEETIIFEKPAGRLISAIAKGDSTREAFWQFYEDTLPQLGWRYVERGSFVRDGESLYIKAEENDSQIVARFTVTPLTK